MSERTSEDQLAAALSAGPSSGEQSEACPSATVAWQVAAGDLVPDAVRAYLDHAAGCPDCTVALRAARSFRRVGKLDSQRSPSALVRGVARVIAALKGSVLSPLPAAAYLIALSVLIWPVLRTTSQPPAPVSAPEIPQQPPAPGPALSNVRALTFSGDVQARGGSEAPLASLGLGTNDQMVLLQLAVDPIDLRGVQLVRVRLSAVGSSEQQLAEHVVERAAIGEDGLVSLLLDSATLEPSMRYRVDLFAVSAGKEPVRIFRQSFRR